ncbi:MAG: WYL domain-containing protein, partial [Chromatiaceae bacterium]
MSATYQTRIQRLRRLEAILPRATTVPAECLDISRLLAILGDAYGQGTAASRRRALQRDLDELVQADRIEVVNPGGKTRHYRRLAGDPQEDALIWQYTLQQVHDLIAEALPLRRIDRLWQRLLHELDAPLLDERRLRLVPDTLRLRP